MIDFNWHEDFELGVTALDDPHRRLLALAGEVAQCLRAGAPKEKIAASVRALSEFAASHFAAEERLMAACGYCENTVHAEHHGELVGQFERFAQRVMTHHSAAGSGKMLAFLRAWVTRHIQHTDRKLAAHLSSRGENTHGG